jgi:hypothetical protein
MTWRMARIGTENVGDGWLCQGWGAGALAAGFETIEAGGIPRPFCGLDGDIAQVYRIRLRWRNRRVADQHVAGRALLCVVLVVALMQVSRQGETRGVHQEGGGKRNSSWTSGHIRSGITD